MLMSSLDCYAKLIFENWLPVTSCLYTNKTIVPTDWSYAKTKVTRPCSRKSSCDPGGFNSQACLVLVLYAIIAWKGIYWLIWWVPQLELFYVSWYIYVSTYIEYMRSGLMVVTPVTISVVFQKWHALTPGQIQPVAHPSTFLHTGLIRQSPKILSLWTRPYKRSVNGTTRLIETPCSSSGIGDWIGWLFNWRVSIWVAGNQ